MAGKVAQGTILARETTLGSGVFTTIANVKSWDGPSTELAEIDLTTLQSTAKEYTGGLPDFGDLTLELNFDPSNATHILIMADLEAQPATITGWRITFVNPTVNWTWSAFPKSCPISGEVDGVIAGSVTLRLSGARVVT